MELGVDYYPEHWDPKDWEPHAKLMEEMGVTVVRLAEFAWARMEPREGRYEFGWLEDAIAPLRARRIKVILGTPTAAPPPWVAAQYPETLAVNQQGIRAQAGGRRHYCFTSPKYRDLTRRIVTAMAGHFRGHASVVGWQTDNEIGGPMCWCDQCAAAFREWLKARYGSIDAFNAAHGTVFWSQVYNDFSEVPLPRPGPGTMDSPSLLLDHKRFHSAQVLSYHRLQVDLLRALCPNHWITHNGMGFYDEVDYWELAKSLDRFALDFYPGTKWGQGKFNCASHDYTRSLKHQPWMVMEQRSGLTGWLEMFNSGDRPGQLRLWTYQTVAHGADTVVYFRWRTCRYGIEQYWHGILDHHGQPGRRYRELQRVGKEFAVLGDRIAGAAYVAPAGILLDPESRWALSIQRGSPDFDPLAHANLWHRAFHRLHAGVEYYHPADDLSNAKVLVAPTLFLCSDTLAAKLHDWVQTGGRLVLTFRSGVKDAANVVVNDRLPGPLKHLAGCVVDEYDALVGGETFAVNALPPLPRKPATARIWCDQLRLQGAKPLARYADGPFKGSPAAALHRLGQGLVATVGFYPDDAFAGALAKWLLQQSGALPPYAPSDEVEITERVKGRDRFVFVLNHAAEARKVALPGRHPWRDLLTGQKVAKTLTLPPFDVRILTPVSA
jgi:beta-galactosidase